MILIIIVVMLNNGIGYLDLQISVLEEEKIHRFDKSDLKANSSEVVNLLDSGEVVNSLKDNEVINLFTMDIVISLFELLSAFCMILVISLIIAIAYMIFQWAKQKIFTSHKDIPISSNGFNNQNTTAVTDKYKSVKPITFINKTLNKPKLTY